ncbi:TPA: hypothetical protein DD449_04070 [Candidatus Berkelbacteria bacterium]|uniref:Uncharacterized protein n=1 Tax=Berkelbacteria bacterium GW2011_GWE1_39_12 TaxID=1618337 RepID=A0A0G4B5J0_9BACT|nr:MAG: hypothetical protein UT28_C0001G0436 [Berkelbacteria bacterium GW2011_GWE1_39_12]HBO60834.1 hypothetical protein [Candidatus Berkelbacteria bacterium]
MRISVMVAMVVLLAALMVAPVSAYRAPVAQNTFHAPIARNTFHAPIARNTFYAPQYRHDRGDRGYGHDNRYQPQPRYSYRQQSRSNRPKLKINIDTINVNIGHKAQPWDERVPVGCNDYPQEQPVYTSQPVVVAPQQEIVVAPQQNVVVHQAAPVYCNNPWNTENAKGFSLEANCKYTVARSCADGSYEEVTSFVLREQRNVFVKDNNGSTVLVFKKKGCEVIARYRVRDIDGDHIIVTADMEKCRPQSGDTLQIR